MAKLTAKGRTLVAGVTRNDDDGFTRSRRLMSDGNILAKWSKESPDGRMTSAWTVRGRLNPQRTAAEWLADKLAKGWQQEDK